MKDNPPMISDFAFWYKEEKYYCTGEDQGFVVVDSKWNRIAYSKNFLQLLSMPLFDDKSFKDLIEGLIIQP